MWRRSCQLLLCSLSLLLWQALIYLAASTASALCSLSKWCSLDCSRGWLNLWQRHLAAASLVAPPKPQLGAASRDAATRCRLYLSVWTEPSLGSIVCLCQLLSKARLWSLSLYLVNFFLNLGSVTELR